jgi:hypothetical protein
VLHGNTMTLPIESRNPTPGAHTALFSRHRTPKMTRQSFVNTVRDFAWLIGVVGGIAGATGMQMITGGSRLTALETRVAALEGNATILNAVALDLCLRTTDPRIRAPLECYKREGGR